MKKILFLIAMVSILCIGCGGAEAETANVDEKDQTISALQNEVDALKAENSEKTNQIEQKDKELSKKESQIKTLEEKTASTIPYKKYVVDLPEEEVLNVRSGPDKSNSVVTTLKGGDDVKVLDEVDNAWAVVYVDDQVAYVKLEFIKPVE